MDPAEMDERMELTPQSRLENPNLRDPNLRFNAFALDSEHQRRAPAQARAEDRVAFAPLPGTGCFSLRRTVAIGPRSN